MVRVRVEGKIKELEDSESPMSSTRGSGKSGSGYETDTATDKEEQRKEKKYRRKKVLQRKRKNTRCRSYDPRHQGRRKRPRRDRRCRSHEGRLPEEEVRRVGNVKRRSSPWEKRASQKSPAKKAKGQASPKSPQNARETSADRGDSEPPEQRQEEELEQRQEEELEQRQEEEPQRAKKSRRSRSRTRTSSHTHSHGGSCVHPNCRRCHRRKRQTDAELYPDVSVFNLQLIGQLTPVVDFVFAKKKWLIVNLTDLTSAVKAVPVDFWMNDNVIKDLQDAAYVIQISLDTLDGQSIVHKYRCLSRECIFIMDPATLEKRAFWQCFRHIDDIYPELLTFLDSQTFFLDNGQKNFFPGKKGKAWPRSTEAHLLPGPSKKFDKTRRFVESPPKTPSLSSLDDSAAVMDKRQPSPQNEPLNLSQKMSATTGTTGTATTTTSTASSSQEEEEEYLSGESPTSQTANVSRSPTLSSAGNPPTPTEELYDPFEHGYYQPPPGTAIDPQKLLDQTNEALRGFDSAGIPETILPDEELAQMNPPDVGMSGDSVNIMDEINLQRAIFQSLGVLANDPQPEFNIPEGAARPPSPSPQHRKLFQLPTATAVNPLEPIVEISTGERPLHPPHQSPMLRTVFTPEAQHAQLPTGPPPTMAVVPYTTADGKTSMQFLPLQPVGPVDAAVPALGMNPGNLAFPENQTSAHVGDRVYYIGASALPHNLGKQYLTICFVMPWGTRHYVRELHSDHTMGDLIYFLQTYLRKYGDIDWCRDIVNLKMANPLRNLSKLPLNTKLKDAKLGPFPVIFVFHFQFLDRLV